MTSLLSTEGLAALRAVVTGSPLLGFDFDGTLAPIVERPETAQVPRALARRLSRLARRWPVAVLTGRSLRDVNARLHFHPRYVVGNHGAEEAGVPPARVDPLALERTRGLLARNAAALDLAGVQVEDKSLSLALHYRLANDPAAALRCIDRVLSAIDPGVRRFGGKCVVNLAPVQAPDKADALWSLVRRSGASTALFVGDDLNDEPVFERAAPQWVTVRIGTSTARTQARFSLDAPADLVDVIDTMLSLPAIP